MKIVTLLFLSIYSLRLHAPRFLNTLILQCVYTVSYYSSLHTTQSTQNDNKSLDLLLHIERANYQKQLVAYKGN